MRAEFRPLGAFRCRLGESPVYDPDRDLLWLVDIVAGRLLACPLDGKEVRVWEFGETVAACGLARRGRLVVALHDRVALFDPATGERRTIATIEADNPATRLNDGKVGPDGAFYVGSMDMSPEKRPIASLYRVGPDGAVRRLVRGLRVSNGLAWSPDGAWMYHSDSRGPWVDRWKFAPGGAISGRVRLICLDEATGRPDGAAVDREGFYWSAGVSAGRLNRISPSGEIRQVLPTPCAAPTMPCFGGRHYDRLFVTSLVPEGGGAPADGLVHEARVDPTGLPPWRFEDRFP